jgi:3-phosphoshikimate 1-carboxyvinyltransferase
VRGVQLRGTVIKEEEAASLRDELPLLAVAASLAEGRTAIHYIAGDLDYISRIVHNLRLMGVMVNLQDRLIEITGSGGKPLQPGCVPGYADFRIAAAFAVAGLFTEGETIIEDTACVDAVWPGFEDELARFQDRSISEGSYTPVLAPVPGKRQVPR